MKNKRKKENLVKEFEFCGRERLREVYRYRKHEQKNLKNGSAFKGFG